MRLLPAILAFVLPAPAQTLALLSVPARNGTTGSVLVTLASPEGKEPLALQWDVAFPNGVLTLSPGDIVTGSSAESAEKSVTCAAQPKSGSDSVMRCILAGGQKTLPNGPIAILKVTSAAKTTAATATLRIERAQAVSREMKSVGLLPTRVEVRLRK